MHLLARFLLLSMGPVYIIRIRSVPEINQRGKLEETRFKRRWENTYKSAEVLDK